MRPRSPVPARLPRATPLIIFLSALLPSTRAEAQAAVDEGAFRLLIGGQEVGRETFSIRRAGSSADAVIIAQGRVSLDAGPTPEEVATKLQVSGMALRPTAYELTVRGDEPRRILGQVVGGRVSARIISPGGEALREYLASDGAVLVDESVAHHYYFLARRLDGAPLRVPLLVPRLSRQVSAQVSVIGIEALTIGNARIEARHAVVEAPGSPTRHFWADQAGRVLRLEIPDRNYVAERIAPPPG